MGLERRPTTARMEDGSPPGPSDAPARGVRELAARIVSERDRAERRLTALQRQFDGIVEAADHANLDDEHDPEGATIGFERAQAAALRDEARSRLAELDDAAARLRAGRIGACSDCGRVIPHERLLARPTATRCVHCAGQP